MTDEARQLFCGVEERGFLLLKNWAITPPGFAWAFYEANK